MDGLDLLEGGFNPEKTARNLEQSLNLGDYGRQSVGEDNNKQEETGMQYTYSNPYNNIASDKIVEDNRFSPILAEDKINKNSDFLNGSSNNFSFDTTDETLETIDIENSDIPNLIGEDTSSMSTVEESYDTEADSDVKIPKSLKICVLVCFAILGCSLIYSTLTKDKPKETTQNKEEPTTSTYNAKVDTLLCSAESYVDYLIINKRLEMSTKDKSIKPIIYGMTTKTKYDLSFQVDLDTYNSLVDGQVISISYNKVSINNELYYCNIEFKEVIAE